jgi:upstream activation factor subunit UAF30
LINDLIGRRFDKAAEQQHLEPTKSEPTEPVPTAVPPAENGVKIKMINSFASSPRDASTGAVHSSKKPSPATQDEQPSGLSEVADSPSPKKKHKKRMSVEDADAAYAARLQAEENGRARSTRGGGAKRKPMIKKEKKKRKSQNRVGSDDDSDAEGSPKKGVNRNSGFHVNLD